MFSHKMIENTPKSFSQAAPSEVLTSPVESAESSSSCRIWKVGTLRYTFRGLTVLFIWLLWGDFCFSLFESIFGRFMPLYLKELKVSNLLIAALTGSVAGLLNILLLPHISMASDRYRSRWGRRVPFLAWSTPCTVLSLAVIGWAPEIATWLHTNIGPLGGFTPAGITLCILSVFIVSWHFFNMVLVNIFRFLLKDVVPDEAMPRMLSYFTIVGTAGGMFFNWFLFPHVLEERKLICAGVGTLYLIFFGLMCWRIKEGRYPPPPPKQKGYFSTLCVYFRECLSIPIYRNIVMVSVLMTFAGATGNFSLLYFTKTLGISTEIQGRFGVATSFCSIVVMIPMGYICRKLHAPRLILAAAFSLVLFQIFGYWFLCNEPTWVAFAFIGVIPAAAWNLALATLQMELFPAAKFGQYFSSTNAIGYGSGAIGNLLIGRFFDMANSNYRLYFLILLLCYAAAIVPLTMIYRDWKRYGGPDQYVPP